LEGKPERDFRYAGIIRIKFTGHWRSRVKLSASPKRRFGSPNGFKLADAAGTRKRAAEKKNSPQACPIYLSQAK
jgi:hypothetical protein